MKLQSHFYIIVIAVTCISRNVWQKQKTKDIKIRGTCDYESEDSIFAPEK